MKTYAVPSMAQEFVGQTHAKTFGSRMTSPVGERFKPAMAGMHSHTHQMPPPEAASPGLPPVDPEEGSDRAQQLEFSQPVLAFLAALAAWRVHAGLDGTVRGAARTSNFGDERTVFEESSKSKSQR